MSTGCLFHRGLESLISILYLVCLKKKVQKQITPPKIKSTPFKMCGWKYESVTVHDYQWISVYTWSLHVVMYHSGVAVLTLCRDVLSTSWNGEGSIRICSISIGLSSSASSQALICSSQSQGSQIDCECSEFWIIDLSGLIILLFAVWMLNHSCTVPPLVTWCQSAEGASCPEQSQSERQTEGQSH